MKITDKIYIKVEYVECPYCGEYCRHWLCDPRGETTTCDACDNEFEVMIDALPIIIN